MLVRLIKEISKYSLTLRINLHNPSNASKNGGVSLVKHGVMVLLSTFTAACGPQLSDATFAVQSHSMTTERLSNLTPRAGDILLVPLNCYVCNAIESETGTPYSHAVVVSNTTSDPEKRFVYEAWGELKKTSYREILQRKQKNQALFLMRPSSFRTGQTPSEIQLRQNFEKNFAGLSFDDEYLWNNTDENGKEKIYCTEFVIKYINSFIRRPIKPQPMGFEKNLEFWKKYYQQFGMTPPTGQIGASPATLYENPELLRLGELNDL
jgi:hypothetical protein